MTDPTALRPPRDETALAIIDMQDRHAAAMEPRAYGRFLRAASNLIALARLTGMPVLLTEQYPRGLGRTVPEIERALADAALPLPGGEGRGEGTPRLVTGPIEKTTFSACGAGAFLPGLRERQRKAAILTGMEAHVCVLETALDLLAAGIRVFVPRDAVISRDPQDLETGLALAREAGAVVTGSEVLIFQTLGRAGTPEFKAMSARLKEIAPSD